MSYCTLTLIAMQGLLMHLRQREGLKSLEEDDIELLVLIA